MTSHEADQGQSTISKLRAAFTKKPAPDQAVAPTSERLVTIAPPVKLKAGEARPSLPERPKISVPLTPPPARCDLCGEEIEASALVEVEHVGACCPACAKSMGEFEQAAIEEAQEQAAVEALLLDQRRRAQPEPTPAPEPVPEPYRFPATGNRMTDVGAFLGQLDRGEVVVERTDVVDPSAEGVAAYAKAQAERMMAERRAEPEPEPTGPLPIEEAMAEGEDDEWDERAEAEQERRDRAREDEDDENRGSDLYTEEQHDALMRTLGEGARSPSVAMPEDTIDGHLVPGSGWTEGDEREAVLVTPAVDMSKAAADAEHFPKVTAEIITPDPIARVIETQIVPMMVAKAERDIDRVIAQAEAIERVRYGGPDGITRAAEAIAEYITYIKGQFIGRDEMIETATLAMIARMHAVYIGPAGTAKSQVLDTLVRGIEDVLKGSAQGNSFMTPDELIGPISLAEIETNDRYVRKTEGRLAGVQLHILDECFKLTSKSFNFLLRSLNEREIYNPEAQRIPLHTCLGASNEYPNDPDLRALRDRFAIKMFVEYVTSEQFIAMMRLKQDAEPEITVSWSAFERLCAEVDRLEDEPSAIPDRVMELLLDLRTHLTGEKVGVSDRLFRWARRILIAKALLDGRSTVGAQDLWCLQHTLWDDQKDRPKVKQAIETLIGKLDQTLSELGVMIESVSEGWTKYVQAADQGGPGSATATGMKVRGETMVKVRDIGNTLVQIEGGESMTAEQRQIFEGLVAKLDLLRGALNPVKGVAVSSTR